MSLPVSLGQRWQIVWQTEALRYSSEQAASNLGVDKSTLNRMLLWNIRPCAWRFGFCQCKNVGNLCTAVLGKNCLDKTLCARIRAPLVIRKEIGPALDLLDSVPTLAI